MPAVRLSHLHRNGGFSFVELLFAILILGIGLIMVAAIFPAGLVQTKANVDETQAAAIGRGAVGQVQAVATKVILVNQTDVVSMEAAPATAILQKAAAENMISPSDPRYAWVGMYYRPTAVQDYAQVIFIVTNRSNRYVYGVDNANGSNAVQVLEPRPVDCTVTSANVTISGDGSVLIANTSNADAVAAGAFMVIRGYTPTTAQATADLSIADSAGVTIPGPPSAADIDQATAHMTGRCFRIGERATSGAGYDWFPGFEFQPVKFAYFDTTTTAYRYITVNQMTGGTRGFVVGRNRVGFAGAANEFDGPVQDVAYYTSFVSVK